MTHIILYRRKKIRKKLDSGTKRVYHKIQTFVFYGGIVQAVTIKDTAKIANVDVNTVSRALNDEAGVKAQTKDRIDQIAAELSYPPNVMARSLNEKHTRIIALFLPGIEMSVFTSGAEGAEAVANEQGYSVVF